MHTPDVVPPERLEKLIDGAVPEAEREAIVQRLVLELRTAAIPAPDSLRERVAASTRETVRPRRFSVPRRRAALAFAIALVVAAASAGAAALVGESDENQALRSAERGVPTVAGEAQFRPEITRNFSAPSPSLAPLSGATASRERARDVDMWIELRLRDADRLSEAANAAMATTRELGGFVASSTVGTRGDEGRAQLLLRVPVERVDDALFRLSQLGTITGQRVVTTDLQGEIDRRSSTISRLRSAIAVAELKLRSGTLSREERLELQIQVARKRSQLAEAERARDRLEREAATAELTLVLHTRAAPSAQEDESRLAAAARNGLDFLAGAGSIALFLAIVLSPLLALVVGAWLVLRARSRRLEDRLLERPRPTGPAQQPRVHS
jgi:hypothetical protein